MKLQNGPRGARPRLEGKPRTPLSSRVATRVSWSPLSGLKGPAEKQRRRLHTPLASGGWAGRRRNKLPCFCAPPRANALMPPHLLGTWRTPPSTLYHPSCPERQDAERKDQVTPSCQEIPDSPYCPRDFFLQRNSPRESPLAAA